MLTIGRKQSESNSISGECGMGGLMADLGLVAVWFYPLMEEITIKGLLGLT
ncbi:MAG: hypothetical protein SPI30_10755 [Prevotella sp.]|nr:hypothetical protein [Prevotella sp.]